MWSDGGEAGQSVVTSQVEWRHDLAALAFPVARWSDVHAYWSDVSTSSAAIHVG